MSVSVCQGVCVSEGVCVSVCDGENLVPIWFRYINGKQVQIKRQKKFRHPRAKDRDTHKLGPHTHTQIHPHTHTNTHTHTHTLTGTHTHSHRHTHTHTHTQIEIKTTYCKRKGRTGILNKIIFLIRPPH